MSLEVQYKTLDGRMSAKFAGSDVKEVFEQIAKFGEVMETATKCQCGSEDIRLSVRVVEDNKYYEKVCTKCGKSFSYGQHKKGGTLFPKWDKGWSKWQNPKEDDGVEPDVFDAAAAKTKKGR